MTSFHPDASIAVTDILSKLENWKRTGLNTNQSSSSNYNSSNHDNIELFQQEIKLKLKNLLKSKILRGFPLNIAFTDIQHILNHIKSLCIHETKHPEVQFVLGVRAFPIVNNMVSLWIYIGTLETSPNNR